MRLLYFPQLSMRSYEDSAWLFVNDSQVTKMRAYVEAAPGDWEWTWLLPHPVQIDGAEWRRVLPSNVRVEHVDWMDNVLQGRYFFPMRQFMQLIWSRSYDVMLLEVPEHARAVRVAQQYTDRDFPVISMVEHVDIYEETRLNPDVSFTLGQISGALASDATAFPLQGMKTEWLLAARDVLGREALDELVDSGLHVWNAIFSTREVEATLDTSELAEFEATQKRRPIVYFISRLSDNKRTHYLEFFDAVNAMDDVDFDVWVANPNRAMTEEQVRARCPRVSRVGNSSRREYIMDLWCADVVPVLYPQSLIYSTGFCEAITADCVMLTHEREGEESAGIVLSSVTPKSVEDGLRAALALDDLNREILLDSQRKYVEERSVEKQIGRVIATVEEVVRGVGGRAQGEGVPGPEGPVSLDRV